MSGKELGKELDEHIRRMVDDWPPFTPEQKSRLAVLMRPSAEPDRTPNARKAAA